MKRMRVSVDAQKTVEFVIGSHAKGVKGDGGWVGQSFALSQSRHQQVRQSAHEFWKYIKNHADESFYKTIASECMKDELLRKL